MTIQNKLTISVKEMAGYMGLSLPKAYELTHIQGFPVIKVGRKKIILVEGFLNWLKENSGNTFPSLAKERLENRRKRIK